MGDRRATGRAGSSSARRRARFRRGIRPDGGQDFIDQADGFLPLAAAARTLELSETETVEACAGGLLEADERGGVLYVRPAIVTVLGVAS